MANTSTIAVYNPVVNMNPWKKNLPGVEFFLRGLSIVSKGPSTNYGLSTRMISPLFTVSQPVSSSTFDSSDKIVICEVLLGVRYKYLWKVKRAKTPQFTYSLPFLNSNRPPFWIWPAHFNHSSSNYALTVTDKWASVGLPREDFLI